jgi:hypothetical protein
MKLKIVFIAMLGLCSSTLLAQPKKDKQAGVKADVKADTAKKSCFAVKYHHH